MMKSRNRDNDSARSTKMNEQQIKIMKQMGNEWQKGDKHRIYFNSLGMFYGIETERYNSGNICGATLNGERISNGEAKRLLGRLMDCKVYYDMVAGQFMMQTPQGSTTHKEMCQIIINNIRSFITEKSAEVTQ
jgi:hypothetical protein